MDKVFDILDFIKISKLPILILGEKEIDSFNWG